LFGARDQATGEVVLAGERYRLEEMSPARAMRVGMALVPGDRRKYGAIGAFSVADNVNSVTLDRYYNGFRVRMGRMQAAAARPGVIYDVRTRDPTLGYVLLSGGKQQQAVVLPAAGAVPVQVPDGEKNG